jgi:alpha-beta hydrolase superfamily lysophospholipase
LLLRESGYVAQLSIHEAVIKGLVATLRTDKFGKPASSVILVGHSQGTIYSNQAMHSDPNIADAAILTGIAYNVSGTPIQDQSKQNRLSNLLKPKKWGSYDGGWVGAVDEYSDIEK